MVGLTNWFGVEYNKGVVGNCGKLCVKLQFLWIIIMFIGEYLHSIDNKKRLSVPAKFRGELGNHAILTKGIDNCLVLYPIGQWEKVAEKLQNLPSQVDARGFARNFLSGAVEVELDRLGRILIPDYLKNYARLEKSVAILGLSNRIEIWNADAWQEYRDRIEAAVGDMAERLKELGI